MTTRVIAFWATLLAWAIGGTAAADEGAGAVKAMSFNIRYGTAKDGDDHWDRRKDFLVDVIEQTAPDLLGTQETLAFQRDFLVARLADYECFSAGRDDGREQGEMTPVFWKKDRFEKLDGGHFWLSETPEKAGSKGWDAQLPRLATWVKLKDRSAPDARPILFLNTHFDHRGETARLESAKLLRRQLALLGRDASLVVTGDFNAGEGSAPYHALFDRADELDSAVVDSYRVAHPERRENEGTFNGFKPGNDSGARIDWIAVSRDWKVSGAEIDRVTRDGRTPSDHYPIRAELRR